MLIETSGKVFRESIEPVNYNLIEEFKKISQKLLKQKELPLRDGSNESEELLSFLGTSSTRPGQVCAASAILYQKVGKAILMDCAEGSYNQLLDHFESDFDKLNDLLKNLKVIFITHIHGDHQLGVLKLLSERDSLDPEDKVFVVTPSPMMEWMKLFCKDSLTYKNKVELIDSSTLNPEKNYYY